MLGSVSHSQERGRHLQQVGHTAALTRLMLLPVIQSSAATSVIIHTSAVIFLIRFIFINTLISGVVVISLVFDS